MPLQLHPEYIVTLHGIYSDASCNTILEASHIYAMVNEYVCNPDKVNNLTAYRLITLRLIGY